MGYATVYQMALGGPGVIEELLKQGPVLTDGAWGTELQARGLRLGECPEAWNLERPAEVEAVGRAYVEARSRVILTNTFGAHSLYLLEIGVDERAAKVKCAAVRTPRAA